MLRTEFVMQFYNSATQFEFISGAQQVLGEQEVSG